MRHLPSSRATSRTYIAAIVAAWRAMPLPRVGIKLTVRGCNLIAALTVPARDIAAAISEAQEILLQLTASVGEPPPQSAALLVAEEGSLFYWETRRWG